MLGQTVPLSIVPFQCMCTFWFSHLPPEFFVPSLTTPEIEPLQSSNLSGITVPSGLRVFKLNACSDLFSSKATRDQDGSLSQSWRLHFLIFSLSSNSPLIFIHCSCHELFIIGALDTIKIIAPLRSTAISGVVQYIGASSMGLSCTV